MSSSQHLTNPLNDQQVIMLRLLQKPLPEEDFIQMRRLAVKLLAKHLDESIEKWEMDNDISEETYDKLSKGHFRSASPNRSK
jgi:hypothetical protein